MSDIRIFKGDGKRAEDVTGELGDRIKALTAERDEHWKSFVHWRKEADALTEQLEAARADAKEAEAYAEELEKERDDLINRITAMETGDWSKVRLVRFENGQLDLAAGPIPVIAEYFAQMMEDGEGKYFNFMEMQINHKFAVPMVLSLQRKNGQTPNDLRKAAEAKLAKAVEALRDAVHAWDTHIKTGDMMQGDWEYDARATLAEIEGEKG